VAQHLDRIMSRGLGRRQLTILGILARYEANGEETSHGLRVADIAHLVEPSMRRSTSVLSSIRRALAKMRSKGLVEAPYYYPHLQGQPNLWKITRAGGVEVDHLIEYGTADDRGPSSTDRHDGEGKQ
jgi:hypothetical protein